MADNKSRVVVKVNVDVSEALTGLKAVQREAREAAKALRELEEAQKRSQAWPRIPFVGHPNTSSDIPPHIKKYGKGEGWSNKGKPSNSRAWFENESAQSITDDIRRSYEVGGDGE